jgi:hypothetical protein
MPHRWPRLLRTPSGPGRPPAACRDHKEDWRRVRLANYKRRYRAAKAEIEAAAVEKIAADRLEAMVQARLRELLALSAERAA